MVSVSHGAGSPTQLGQRDEGLIRFDERRRIACELHDSTSQLLVVLQLQLRRLEELTDAEAQSVIEECRSEIEEIRRQIRGLGLD